MRPLRSLRPHIACLLLSLYLPACTSTQVVAAPTPAQLVETARPPSIRGTLANGSNFTLVSPVVRGDSLVGTVGSQEAPRTVSLALSNIRSVSVGQGTDNSWQAGMPTPAQYLATEHPQSIQVTLIDGGTLTLKAPVIRGDSLMGSVWSADAAPSTGVVLSDVASLSVKKVQAGKTLLVVLVIPLVGLVLLAGLAAAMGGAD